MDIKPIIASIAEQFPKAAALLAVDDMAPHDDVVITSLLHKAITAKQSFIRRAADLQSTINMGHTITPRLEDLLQAEVAVEVAMTLLHPIERGLERGAENEQIRSEIMNMVLRMLASTDLPRSSGMIHNARAVMVIEAYRRAYDDLRFA
ncbi:hypothetical protein SEA_VALENTINIPUFF_83 [Microbacterium phage ValentiniPuff]|uniref:Uncharacterized protein n=1 Tax=Microbacterium phage ValentiniPuff TaxID=2315705 RepID=A0A386KP52_9CAUD|nr:hypothetical protein SEA_VALENTINIPUFF_83 [Microbacterium phage ValentiniPuff]